MKSTITTIMICFIFAPLYGQNVMISESESTADASALLDIQSTSKGVLIPRMTQAQRELISTPATGLLVYQTDGEAAFYFYGGSSWIPLLDEAEEDPAFTSSAANNITDSGSGEVITSDERTQFGQSAPAGSIIAFGGPTIPDGWLLCDGSEVSEADYPELHDAIGDFWGTASTTDLFVLPDLQGRFLRGHDNGAGNDPDASARTD